MDDVCGTSSVNGPGGYSHDGEGVNIAYIDGSVHWLMINDLEWLLTQGGFAKAMLFDRADKD